MPWCIGIVPMGDSPQTGTARCSSCSGLLDPSGQEPYRLICSKCGQNYFLVSYLKPVPPRTVTLPKLPEGEGDAV